MLEVYAFVGSLMPHVTVVSGSYEPPTIPYRANCVYMQHYFGGK